MSTSADLGQDVVIDEVETVEVETAEKPVEKVESVSETVRRAYEELQQGKQEEGKQQEEGRQEVLEQPETATDESKEQEAVAAETPKNGGKSADSENIAPPQRWSAESKEWFNKLPPQAKKEFAKAAREQEAYFTNVAQQLAAVRKEYQELDEITKVYGPTLHERGLSVTQAIREFFAANHALEKEPVAALKRIMAAKGVTVDQLRDGDEPSGKPSKAENEQIALLRSELEQLKLKEYERESYTREQAVTSIADEFSQVRDQQDGQGRYLYPKMHEPGFMQGLKPLVIALRESHPEISWGEALKRAYHFREGTPAYTQQPNFSPQQQQQQSQPKINNRARAVSTAMRTSGGNAVNLGEVKTPKSIEETVRLAMRLHSQG